MLYQVQFRQPAGSWQNYQNAVPVFAVDPLRAQCHINHPECEIRVVSGNSVEDLHQKVNQPESWEDRKREAIERGPGGDHDVPYAYRPPLSWPVRLAWLRLAARWHRGEFKEDVA